MSVATVTLTIQSTETVTLPAGVTFQQYLYTISPPGGGAPLDVVSTALLTADLHITDTPGDYVATVSAIDQNFQPIEGGFTFHFQLPFATDFQRPSAIGISVAVSG